MTAGCRRSLRWVTAMCVWCATIAALGTMLGAAHGATKRGTLVISSSVSGGVVSINDKEIGKTPIGRRLLRPGRYQIAVKKLGFLSFSAKVTIKANESLSLFADLLPFKGVIDVRANVPNAEVSVGGKVLGTVPIEAEIGLGKRVIVVSAPGHKRFEKLIKSTPGQVFVINAKLEARQPVDPMAMLVPIQTPAATAPDVSKSPSATNSKTSDRTSEKKFAKKFAKKFDDPLSDPMSLVGLSPAPAQKASKAPRQSKTSPASRPDPPLDPMNALALQPLHPQKPAKSAGPTTVVGQTNKVDAHGSAVGTSASSEQPSKTPRHQDEPPTELAMAAAKPHTQNPAGNLYPQPNIGVGSPTTILREVPAAKKAWYRDWKVLSGAGAVVTGTLVAIILARQSQGDDPDYRWSPQLSGNTSP